jgi:hypothetical protein
LGIYISGTAEGRAFPGPINIMSYFLLRLLHHGIGPSQRLQLPSSRAERELGWL